MASFAGRVIMVTGAASGIGRVTAEQLAAAGARVVAADLSDVGQEVVDGIVALGGTASFVQTDVANENEVAASVDAAVNEHGALHGAANCAGIGGPLAPIHEISAEYWHRIMAVDLEGVFYCMKHQIRAMLNSGGGTIVNVASALGATALPLMGPYVAAKHGVAGLTKAAALDYAEKAIRVNAVMPGPIDTPMIRNAIPPEKQQEFIAKLTEMQPMPRVGQPEDVAGAISWLLSDAASFVTGSTVFVDGGTNAI